MSQAIESKPLWFTRIRLGKVHHDNWTHEASAGVKLPNDGHNNHLPIRANFYMWHACTWKSVFQGKEEREDGFPPAWWETVDRVRGQTSSGSWSRTRINIFVNLVICTPWKSQIYIHTINDKSQTAKPTKICGGIAMRLEEGKLVSAEIYLCTHRQHKLYNTQCTMHIHATQYVNKISWKNHHHQHDEYIILWGLTRLRKIFQPLPNGLVLISAANSFNLRWAIVHCQVIKNASRSLRPLPLDRV